jgi:hypothetical protein
MPDAGAVFLFTAAASLPLDIASGSILLPAIAVFDPDDGENEGCAPRRSGVQSMNLVRQRTRQPPNHRWR